jgi:hypothetical protein
MLDDGVYQQLTAYRLQLLLVESSFNEVSMGGFNHPDLTHSQVAEGFDNTVLYRFSYPGVVGNLNGVKVSAGRFLRPWLSFMPVFLSYRVGEELTADHLQHIWGQVGVQPVYVHYPNIGDSGYPQVVYIFGDAKPSGIGQVTL